VMIYCLAHSKWWHRK